MSAVSILNETLEIDERLKAAASIYQLTDSILAGERLSVSIVNGDPKAPPAWTSGTEISINASTLDTRDFDDVVKLHGLNFHELAHVLYTPRAGTSLSQWVIDHYLFQAFNLLEDQRIESMMSVRYPSTAPWLTAAILRWVIGKPEALETGYLYVRGRRYLPGELRGTLRSTFRRPDLLGDIDRIVDSYRRLVFPTDYDAARPLITDMDRVLRELMYDGKGGVSSDPNGHGGRDSLPTKGRPVSVKEQRDNRDRMSDPSPAAPKDDQDEDPQDPQGGHSEASNDDEGTPADVKGAPGNDSEAPQSEPESASEAGLGVGMGSNQEEVLERLEEMLDDLVDTPEVRNDVLRTQRQIRVATTGDSLPYNPFYNEPADHEYVMMAHQLTRTLDRLREEAEPGWHREEETGRLNVVRWAVDRDPQTAFDRWDEGVTDAVDIEAVILLDISGSMNMVIDHANNAMWALKRSFDMSEISSTVLVFDDKSTTLYRSTDRADGASIRRPSGGGGTDPSEGLSQAARILGTTKKRHKVLIAITDGEWNSWRDEYGLSCDDYVARMNDAGVMTALGFIADNGWYSEELTDQQRVEKAKENSHGCRIAVPAHGQNLVPFISGVVTDLVRQQIMAHR